MSKKLRYNLYSYNFNNQSKSERPIMYADIEEKHFHLGTTPIIESLTDPIKDEENGSYAIPQVEHPIYYFTVRYAPNTKIKVLQLDLCNRVYNSKENSDKTCKDPKYKDIATGFFTDLQDTGCQVKYNIDMSKNFEDFIDTQLLLNYFLYQVKSRLFHRLVMAKDIHYEALARFYETLATRYTIDYVEIPRLVDVEMLATIKED